MQRFTGSIVLAVVVVTLSSAPALACGREPGTPVIVTPDDTHAHWGIAYGVVGAVDVALIALDITLHEEGFPAWLGAIELALGIAQSALAGGLLGYLWIGSGNSCGSGASTEHLLVGSSALVISGGWLITHGILSMSTARARAAQVAPSVAIGPEGAVLSVVGSF